MIVVDLSDDAPIKALKKNHLKKKHSEFFESKINENELVYKPASKKVHTEGKPEKSKTKEKMETPKSHRKKEIKLVSEEKKTKGIIIEEKGIVIEEKRTKKKNIKEQELYEFESGSKKKTFRGQDIIQLTPKSYEKIHKTKLPPLLQGTPPSNPTKEKEKKIITLKLSPLPSSSKKKEPAPKEEKKGKQKQPTDNLSLDDFIKQIENNLDLHNFSNQADSYQKELNHYKESIQENSFIEELKDDGNEKKSQPSKSKKNTGMEIESQKDLLQENINLIKNFKKEHKLKDKDLSQEKSQKTYKHLEKADTSKSTQKLPENSEQTEKPQNPEKEEKIEKIEKNEKHEKDEKLSKHDKNELHEKMLDQQKTENIKGLCLKSAPEPVFEKAAGLEKEDEKKKNAGKKKNLSLEEFLKSIGRMPDQKKYKIKDFPNEKNEQVLNEMLSKVYRRFKKHKLDEDELVCDVCLDKASSDDNLILICDLCEGSIHQSCYGSELLNFVPEHFWYCSRCKYLIQNSLDYRAIKCLFCPEIKGIIKMLDNSEQLWGHISCIEWNQSLYFADPEKEKISWEDFRKKKPEENVCCFCEIEYGCCIKCEDSSCDQSFHVTCAQRRGFIYYLDRDSIELRQQQNIIFCKKHRKNHSAEVQDEIKRKYLCFYENPRKYSLILDKEEYQAHAFRSKSKDKLEKIDKKDTPLKSSKLLEITAESKNEGKKPDESENVEKSSKDKEKFKSPEKLVFTPKPIEKTFTKSFVGKAISPIVPEVQNPKTIPEKENLAQTNVEVNEEKNLESVQREMQPDDAYEFSSHYIDKNVSTDKLENILDDDFRGLSILI